MQVFVVLVNVYVRFIKSVGDGYCRNKTRDPHYGNHGCADNGEQDAYKIICYRIYLEPIEWK